MEVGLKAVASKPWALRLLDRGSGRGGLYGDQCLSAWPPAPPEPGLPPEPRIPCLSALGSLSLAQMCALEPKAPQTDPALLGASPGGEGAAQSQHSPQSSGLPAVRGGLASSPQEAPNSWAASPICSKVEGSRICSHHPQCMGRGADTGHRQGSAQSHLSPRGSHQRAP